MNLFERLYAIFSERTANSSTSNSLQWVSVPGFEKGYEINIRGVIRSKGHRYYHKLLPQKENNRGYLTVKLSNGGVSSSQFVHRLLALAFIPNPDGKAFVNHKNGIKTDNRINNLEWVTHQENISHAYSTGLISMDSKVKRVKDTCTGRTYESIKEAASDLGIPYSTCKNYLNGRRPNPTCLKLAA
jgi:hypothetical protein